MPGSTSVQDECLHLMIHGNRPDLIPEREHVVIFCISKTRPPHEHDRRRPVRSLAENTHGVRAVPNGLLCYGASIAMLVSVQLLSSLELGPCSLVRNSRIAKPPVASAGNSDIDMRLDSTAPGQELSFYYWIKDGTVVDMSLYH